MTVNRATVRVSKVPLTIAAKELFDFFESTLGKDSVFACEILTERKNWKSRGFGRVQFDKTESANAAYLLSQHGKLVFQGTHLEISPSFDDIIHRPTQPQNRLCSALLHVGFLVQEDRFSVLESWEGVKTDVMPERKIIEFWVPLNGDIYKLRIQFEDIFSVSRCSPRGGDSNAVLLKLKYAPKIFQKFSGPTVASKHSTNRYYMCKEDFDFIWVRTVEFSVLKSIGQSTSFCLQLQEGSLASKLLDSFPYYEGQVGSLTLEQTGQSCGAAQIVPIVQSPSDFKLDYEILYQLNALVHSQKISIVAANNDLMEILSSISADLAINILQKLHKLKSSCYDPLSFVQDQLERLRGNQIKKSLPSSLKDRNFMRCHRVLVTPSKIYCLGPEIETSNYIVRHYAEYASDFIRLTFVDEDWRKLQSDALSTSIESGLFSVPHKTSIYHRILSILRDGIVIGGKRFEFLAFSASQLRSGSIWMFASNGTVNAGDIREWMGCFKSIRSISKCAARMGQLFSSSRQIFDVPAREVENIPDVEVTTDGVKYCFSDGIGRISSSFAKQVAKKCGLKEVPSAFQIRYGGYKGVIAVDRNSFRKMSLRKSMMKFDSNNRMLNITSWSESQPCYLNREIITLLSTLGVEDEKFLALQYEQTKLLNKMLYDTEAARKVLEYTSGLDTKHFLVQMLLHGYQPSTEPFLSMMLRAHHEFMISDMRSKCRIFVPKARVLMGCMDETGTLCYGQVYIRVTLTRAELQCRDQTYFRNVDDKTAIIVGKVVVTKNPCLHPGDIRVLDAVYEPLLEEKGLFDCVLFPQKGPRPHPNECSGGDLDGDLYFTCWDENLVPPQTDTPMDYMGRRPRIMDHDVTLEEIQKFFVDYMINDTLGQISIAHLIHADRSPEKARSPECIRLANLHSMAVDFAKTGAPAEMPRVLRPKEYPDFMEREDKGSYQSTGVLGKLYRTAMLTVENPDSNTIPSEKITKTNYYDPELEADGFEAFLDAAESYKNDYEKKFIALMNYFGAENEEEILTGNLRNRSMYLQHEKTKYNEMKDRILVSMKCLEREVKGWFQESCKKDEHSKMASAWYHVSYHPNYCENGTNFLRFPWIVGDALIKIKATRRKRKYHQLLVESLELGNFEREGIPSEDVV